MELSYLAFLATIEGRSFEAFSYKGTEKHIGKDKECTLYRAHDKQSENKVVFVDRSTRQGISRAWYASGREQIITPMKDGLEHGVEIEYYENGTVKCQTSYVEGTLHGLYTEYYPSGKVKICMRYAGGEPMGSYQFFGEDGTLLVFKMIVDPRTKSCGAF